MRPLLSTSLIQYFIFLVLTFILFTACKVSPSSSSMPPNIIIILADDMGFSDLACTGAEYPTPHLDRLAHEGVLMTQFYNAARCCPSRAALLTGLYPHQAGMGDMVEGRLRLDSTFLPSYQGWLKTEFPTIAEVLRAVGYQTYFSGKWHVGNEQQHRPDVRGFERSFAMIHGAGNYFNNEPWITHHQFLQYTLDGKPYTLPTECYLTDLITDHALSFIKDSSTNKPFFLYLSYTAPHWPLHAKEEDIQRFQGLYMEGWETIRQQRFEKQKELGLFPPDASLSNPFKNEQKPLLTPDWDTLSVKSRLKWDRRMATYAAQMYAMDKGIGKIIQQLTQSGQLENTLILFLSDNGATNAAIYLANSWVADRSGPIGSAQSFDSYGAMWANVSNTPFQLFKSRTMEGGIRTPLIAYFPKRFPARIETQTYGHIIDIFSSCLNLAEINEDSDHFVPTEGISLLPLWEDRSLPSGRPLYWEHHDNWAVRKGPWKLVHSPPNNPQNKDQTQLFHLENDPAELINLSTQYPDKASELRASYQNWADSVGVVPLDSLILARPL